MIVEPSSSNGMQSQESESQTNTLSHSQSNGVSSVSQSISPENQGNMGDGPTIGQRREEGNF